MHIRHIRPRSVDWYDALLEDDAHGFDRLSPEEKTKLRTLLATEEVNVAALGAAARVRHEPRRML